MAMRLPKLGALVYLLTLPAAVVLGLVQELALVDVSAFDLLLVIVGLAAGILLIQKRESLAFLVAVIALPVASTALALLPVGLDLINAVFAKIALVSGATVAVVAIKVIYNAYKRG